MWGAAQILIVALSGMIVLRILAGTRRETGFLDTSLVFVVVAIWLRCVAALFHSTTYGSVLGGMSINALLSMVTVFVGFFLIQPRLLLAIVFLPFWMLIATILVSALVNGEFGGFVTQFFKWCYFVVIAAHTWRALSTLGQELVVPALLSALSLPLVAQIFSIVLGNVKAAESDGSRSFIGGFNHESTLSMLLLAALVLTAHLSRPRQGALSIRTPLAALAAIGIVLANYRTSLLAGAPVLVATFIERAAAPWQTRSQGVVVLIVVCILGAVAVFAADLLQERFVDLLSGSEVMRLTFSAPENFTTVQQDLFSARAYLWSQYLSQWYEGDFSVWLLGYGPEAWRGEITKYAHNTFIGQLYDGGLLGTLALIVMFSVNILIAVRIAIVHGSVVTVSAQLGFLTLNFATMPLWQVEGLIAFALLSALTWSRGLEQPAPISISVALRPRDRHSGPDPTELLAASSIAARGGRRS